MSDIVAMTQASPAQDLLAEILALETRVWEALISGDAAMDETLLLPEFLGVYPSGFSGRSDHVNQLSDDPTISAFELSQARLMQVGHDHAMLSYHAAFRRIRASQDDHMYVSSLWQRTEHGWRNLFSQDTPAQGPLPD